MTRPGSPCWRRTRGPSSCVHKQIFLCWRANIILLPVRGGEDVDGAAHDHLQGLERGDHHGQHLGHLQPAGPHPVVGVHQRVHRVVHNLPPDYLTRYQLLCIRAVNRPSRNFTGAFSGHCETSRKFVDSCSCETHHEPAAGGGEADVWVPGEPEHGHVVVPGQGDTGDTSHSHSSYQWRKISFCFLSTMKTVSTSSGSLDSTNSQVQSAVTWSWHNQSRYLHRYTGIYTDHRYLHIYTGCPPCRGSVCHRRCSARPWWPDRAGTQARCAACPLCWTRSYYNSYLHIYNTRAPCSTMFHPCSDLNIAREKLQTARGRRRPYGSLASSRYEIWCGLHFHCSATCPSWGETPRIWRGGRRGRRGSRWPPSWSASTQTRRTAGNPAHAAHHQPAAVLCWAGEGKLAAQSWAWSPLRVRYIQLELLSGQWTSIVLVQ